MYARGVYDVCASQSVFWVRFLRFVSNRDRFPSYFGGVESCGLDFNIIIMIMIIVILLLPCVTYLRRFCFFVFFFFPRRIRSL